MDRYHLQANLVTVDCPECCLTFAVPEAMVQERQRSSDWFSCPNGHWIHFSGSVLERYTGYGYGGRHDYGGNLVEDPVLSALQTAAATVSDDDPDFDDDLDDDFDEP